MDVRELKMPDYVFEVILEERKTYAKNADTDQESSRTGIILGVLHMGIQGIKVIIRNIIKTC